MVIGIVDGIIPETKDCEILADGEIGELIIGARTWSKSTTTTQRQFERTKSRTQRRACSGIAWATPGTWIAMDTFGLLEDATRQSTWGGNGVLHPQIVEQIVAGDGVLTEQAGYV